jgi:hypothetical protein
VVWRYAGMKIGDYWRGHCLQLAMECFLRKFFLWRFQLSDMSCDNTLTPSLLSEVSSLRPLSIVRLQPPQAKPYLTGWADFTWICSIIYLRFRCFHSRRLPLLSACKILSYPSPSYRICSIIFAKSYLDQYNGLFR